MLSTVGKKILIKSVLQAILAYTMSVFRLPSILLKEIEAMLNQFWWNYNKSEKGVHWQSCEKMRKVKDKGGLGFINLISFNNALPTKQLGRLLNEPSSLVA